MESRALQEYLAAVLDYQFDMLWNRQLGEGHTEFLFAHALELLGRDQSLREWFFDLVRFTTSPEAPVIDGRTEQRPARYVPDSFILYAAHVTRWPEFESLARTLKGARDDLWPGNPAKRWSSEILAALRRDWEDREFYESLRAAA